LQSAAHNGCGSAINSAQITSNFFMRERLGGQRTLHQKIFANCGYASPYGSARW
jgi:hypothetical protein